MAYDIFDIAVGWGRHLRDNTFFSAPALKTMAKRIKFRRPLPTKPAANKTAAEIARELKEGAASASNYREQSLKIHGLICAKCGREFDFKDRKLLTVHHKDGNPRNNPTDGSNWENLCIFCHDDEHARGLLGDYLQGKGRGQS